MLPRRNRGRPPRQGRVGQWGKDQAESKGSANLELESKAKTPIVEVCLSEKFRKQSKMSIKILDE